MFVLLWVTLLVSVRSSDADTGASVTEKTTCDFYNYCITLTEGEITAEAGLCAVVPCSYTVSFTPDQIIWYKCDPIHQNCDTELSFLGRVSLLEPDQSRRNCSIVINDLTESDSGSYQLRVKNQYYNYGITFSLKANISVKDLSQKPTLMIPPLTAGQQTTLTCTAPGLCSGSAPTIIWTWRGTGGNHSRVTRNTMTAVTQGHTSTLTFNFSAEHHGTDVTCKVVFLGNRTTEETVTLNVTYVKEVKVTGKTRVKEGDTLNLTCSVESFPPSLIMWTKSSDQTGKKGTETKLLNDPETASLIISNVTAEHAGKYTCTAKHLNNSPTEEVDITVMYKKNPRITGDATVKEGDTLNLTCSVESVPPSLITWTKLGLNTSLHSGSDAELQNNTGLSTLIIPNVTKEHSGRYICTAKHQDRTTSVYLDVTVTWISKILNGSGCVAQSMVLTCVCASQGVPVPTVKWPLTENYKEYSVMTSVLNHTVNSTITLTVNDHSNTAVECVSSNENGEAKENLTVTKNIRDEKKEQATTLLQQFSWLEIIIAFLIGALLSAALCCLVKKCHRKRTKSSGNLDGTMEMVTTHEDEDPLIDAPQVVEYDQTHHQEAVDDGAEEVENGALDLEAGPKDVEYATIDFSVLKRKSPSGAAETQETTETEYAEIKREPKRERQESAEEPEETLDCKEEEVVMGEDEETNRCVPEEEEAEEEALYSSVKDAVGEN